MRFPVYLFKVPARKKTPETHDIWTRVGPYHLVWEHGGHTLTVKKVGATWQLESPLGSRAMDVPKGPDEEYQACRQAMVRVLQMAQRLETALFEGLFDFSQESELKKKRPVRR